MRIDLEFDLRRVDCRRCGGVKRERLDWHAVKEMDKVSMQEQLARAGPLRPAVIGIDENDYRIVVSGVDPRTRSPSASSKG